jgi:thiol-disulfide isomerase/thioredoxin
MKKILLLFCIFWFVESSKAQSIRIIKKPEMMSLLQTPNNGKVRIINFWASWCAPCVKELPYFKQIAENYASQVEVIFISLDFAEEIEKAKKILSKKQIGWDSYLLDETKYDTWISDVHKSWQGAIPVTLLISSKKKIFIEGETTYEDLEKKIKQIL